MAYIFFIIVHTIQGIILWVSNKAAKGVKYAVNTNENSSWASKNMAMLGLLILAFLFIHMGDFWFKMHWEMLPMAEYAGYDDPIADLHSRVSIAYDQLWIVIVYLIGLIALAFHLNHGFSSAFQTLGIRHKKVYPINRVFRESVLNFDPFRICVYSTIHVL